MAEKDQECSLHCNSAPPLQFSIDLRTETYDSTVNGPIGAPFWSLYSKLGLSPWCFLISDSSALPRYDGSSRGIGGKRSDIVARLTDM